MMGSKRMYQDAGLNLDEIVGLEGEELLKHAGQLYKISGLVFQGNERTILLMFPTANELDADFMDSYPDVASLKEQWVVCVDDIVESDARTLQAILKRTDDPLIFEKDETGVLKAIVRKSQRVVSGAVQQKIWIRDGLQCMYCGQMMGTAPMTIDHFVPVERGGADEPSNYLTSCRKCNKKKGNQNPEQYCEEHDLDYNGLRLYLDGKAPKGFVFHL